MNHGERLSSPSSLLKAESAGTGWCLALSAWVLNMSKHWDLLKPVVSLLWCLATYPEEINNVFFCLVGISCVYIHCFASLLYVQCYFCFLSLYITERIRSSLLPPVRYLYTLFRSPWKPCLMRYSPEPPSPCLQSYFKATFESGDPQPVWMQEVSSLGHLMLLWTPACP